MLVCVVRIKVSLLRELQISLSEESFYLVCRSRGWG